MKIIFCRSRHTYDSYTDYWRLVELSGFEIIFVDEMDLTREAVYVFTPFNGESKPAILAARERAGASVRGLVVWWNLERPDTCDLAAVLADTRTFVDDIWVPDIGCGRKYDMRFVLVGGHRDLGKPTSDKIYDVCPLAYLWGRRLAIIEQLRGHGLTIAPEAWTPAQKDVTVGGSRLMLNMHQYGTARTIAPLRFAVAAAYKLPLLSEFADDPTPLAPGVHFHHVPYEHLVVATREMLRDLAEWQVMGENLHQLLCEEHTFAHCVNTGVGALLRERGDQ